MNTFFSKNFPGNPFELFSMPHLAAIGILIGVNCLILLTPYFRIPARRRYFRFGLAWILLLNEFAWHLWNWSTGQWTIQKMLPLHLCSVMVFLSIYMLFTGNYLIYEYLYFLGIAGALQAILTPDLGDYGFPHFRYFQTFISHGGIMTASIFMTVLEGYRPSGKSLVRVALGANIYMGIVFIINQLIGSNYLFISHKPETASMLDVLGPWPWYILWMEVIGIVLCLILYLPFLFRKQKSIPVIS